MNPIIESQAKDLEKSLVQLDSDYQETRRRIMNAIRSLRGEIGSPIGRQTLLPEDVWRASSSPSPESKTETGQPKSAVVDEVIRSMPHRFNTTDLKVALSKKYPAIDFKGSYLPTRLTQYKVWGKLKLVGQGENGGPNVWEKTSLPL